MDFNEKFLIRHQGKQLEVYVRGSYKDWKGDVWLILMMKEDPTTHLRKASQFPSFNYKKVPDLT